MATTKGHFVPVLWSQGVIDDYKTVAMSGMVWRDKYSQMLYEAAEKAEEMAQQGKLDEFELP